MNHESIKRVVFVKRALPLPQRFVIARTDYHWLHIKVGQKHALIVRLSRVQDGFA